MLKWRKAQEHFLYEIRIEGLVLKKLHTSSDLRIDCINKLCRGFYERLYRRARGGDCELYYRESGDGASDGETIWS